MNEMKETEPDAKVSNDSYSFFIRYLPNTRPFSDGSHEHDFRSSTTTRTCLRELPQEEKPLRPCATGVRQL